MPDLVELAKEIATAAHEGQEDKAGMPYICHPQFVADHVESADEKIVAYLHDVLEDTPVTEEHLAQWFPAHIIEAVNALTRRENECYFDFIGRVKLNPLARSVKQADLQHNMMLERIPEPTEKDYLRLDKYREAYCRLA